MVSHQIPGSHKDRISSSSKSGFLLSDVTTIAMTRTGIRNRMLSIIAFPIFHITTVWLPISISYPHWVLWWVTFGKIDIHPLSDWGWVVRGFLLALNVTSFVTIFRLLTVRGHRSILFLINLYGVFPTMIISSFYGAIWNLFYMIPLFIALKKRHREFARPKPQEVTDGS